MKIKYQIRENLSKKLNGLLAAQSTLYFKTKKAHWLTFGPHFKEYHELLDTQAAFILNQIDEIAERVTMLGGTPLGSLAEFKEFSPLKDFSTESKTAHQYLELLLADHESLVLLLRECIDIASNDQDPGTADMLTRIVQEHEKAAWFIRETVRR